MSEQEKSGSERRRFLRLDVNEDVRCLDAKGRDIGRVEKVGAGGMQVRLSENISEADFNSGTKLDISVVEPGDVRNHFKVEVRMRDGKLLGLQFQN